ETYVANLLREFTELAPTDLRIGAVTRQVELLPDGIEPLLLQTSSQELRMAWTLPRLLRKVGADLVHTQYAIPLRCPCPAVVTIPALSFERDPGSMTRRALRVFRSVGPRAARQAACVLTVSERTRRDLEELYEIPPERIVVTPNGIDPVFRPAETDSRDYVLS